MEKITIKTRNNLMYADIPIWSMAENRYLNAFMLIDTGANVTSFAQTALKRLGCYNENKKTRVTTASGVVDVYEVKFPKIRLGNTELVDVDVHSHIHLDNLLFDGIIGMNILRKFNFSVDFDKALLTLENRSYITQ